jgi:hypothetical protein
MNKKLFLLPLLLITLLSIVQYGCETDPEEVCEEYAACDVSATACCTDETNCYYKYNGITYPDTDEGLAALLEAMCPEASAVELKSIQENLNAHTLELINKARLEAICN